MLCSNSMLKQWKLKNIDFFYKFVIYKEACYWCNCNIISDVLQMEENVTEHTFCDKFDHYLWDACKAMFRHCLDIVKMRRYRIPRAWCKILRISRAVCVYPGCINVQKNDIFFWDAKYFNIWIFTSKKSANRVCARWRPRLPVYIITILLRIYRWTDNIGIRRLVRAFAI